MTDRNWMLEFVDPRWLAAFVALPLLIWYFRRGLVDLPRRQQFITLGFRSLIVSLLVLALSGLTIIFPTKQQFVVVAIDASESIGEESRKQVDEYLQKALKHSGDSKIAFLNFAAKPGSVEEKRSAPPAEWDKRGTDIASAINVAAAAIPPSYVPKILLLSDGNQTAGDALKSALKAKFPIHTIPLKPRLEPEVQVSAVNIPAQVREGEPFPVEVVIDSNHEDEGLIEVFRGAHKVASERKKIKKGENKIGFRQSLKNERLASYSVRVTGLTQDTLLDNNSETGLVFTAGKPRVLIVESDVKMARHLASALEEEGVNVEVRPVRGMPDSLTDLQNFELIVLSNVPATSLSQRQMDLARTYVQDLGGGLIMIGGDQSFGLGGYYKTAIEEILPVRSDFEKEKEKPSLAMVLVIDRSGSMAGEKIEMAKEAAKAAVELLGANDKVGVIAFDSESYWISELTSAGAKAAITENIARIEAGGGTSMYPAMEEAYNALHPAAAKIKHAIFLTDGISEPGDFQGLAAQMIASRITVTTVAVGGDADKTLLEEIARIGQGRFYLAEDPASVPQIFAKETVTVSKSAINEQPFTPVLLRPTQALAEIDFASVPFLLGFVVTRPKPTSEVILTTESGEPLLSWWRYGLGMTAAFTSDAKSKWAAEWVTWPGFGKFWVQVVRNTMRKGDSKGMVSQLERHGTKSTISIDAVDPTGKYLNLAETELSLFDPKGTKKLIPMGQVAPGRYTADFDSTDGGAYHLEMTQKVNGRVISRQSRGLHVGYPEELRLKPTNESLLRSLAESNGGSYDVAPELAFAPQESILARRPTPLWPYLLIASLCLFLADVALRRIDFSLILKGRVARFAGS